jgi:PAS domain S-box-containing protein
MITRARKYAVIAIPLLAAIGFMQDLRTQQGVDDWVWYLVSLLLTIFIGRRFLPFWLAGIFSILTLAGFYLSPPGADPAGALVHCYMGISVLWVTAGLIFLQVRSEAALRLAEEKYHAIYENAVAGIFQSTSDGAILSANPAMAAIFGYASPAEFMESVHHVGQQIYADSTRREEFKRLLEERGAATGFEFQARRKDGALIWVSAGARAARDAKGRLLYYEGLMVDITQRKAQELEIQRLTRLYATLSEVNQTIVRCQSPQELFQDICRIMIEFGKFRGVWISENPDGVLATAAHRMSGEDAELVMPGWNNGCGVTAEALRTGRPALCNDNGADARAVCCREVLVRLGIQSCAAFPFRLPGKVGGAISLCSDEVDFFKAEENRLLEEVTLDISYALDRMHEQEQRRRAEEALRLSEIKFSRAFANNPAAIALTRLEDGVVLEVNNTWLDLCGFSRGEIIGRSARMMWPSTGDAADFVRRLREQGVLRGHEQEFRKKSGEIFVVQMSSQALTFNHEQLVLSTLVDVTARKKAEAALLVSDAKWRSYLENAPVGILVADADGRHVEANRAAEELLGYPPGGLLGTGVGDLAAPENGEPLKRHLAELANLGQSGGQFLLRRKDGSLIWALVRASRLAEGGLLGIFQNITELKLAEAALRQSEEQFRATFELASIGMAQADPQTRRFVRVNRKMCEITGYSAAELLQLTPRDLTHPDDWEPERDHFDSVIRGERPSHHTEKRYLRRDGTVAWVNVNMTVIRDADGKPVRTLAAIEDITARKEAERERVRLLTAFEQTAESIVLTDPDGTILHVNPAFEKVSGYTRQEVIGRNPRILKSGRHEAAFYHQLWDTIKKGEAWHGHLVNKRKDGSLFEEDATISPIRDSGGKIVNYMAIKLDVSREVALEAQFRQSQKMDAIGRLAGGVAHDFNNILQVITMQVEMTPAAEKLSPDVAESLREIRAAAERAANLTRQLLLFSRQQVMQKQDVDLNEVVTNLSKMLHRIIGEDVQLQLSLHPAPLFTHADAGMLDQVLLNLAVNARDAMPGGGRLLVATHEIELDEEHARLYPEAVPGRYACLNVSDSGIGIPPDVMPRIFDPFFTTKEAGKGTGLGLATVFGIVKQHGGWIKVQSTPGLGTHFQIFLPACATPPVETTGAAIRQKAPGGTETILLAEDDPALRPLTRTLLERHGYRVLEAASGVEAIKIWRDHRQEVALLLSDIVMPGGLSGQQLARLLREQNPQLKIIYTSGYSAEIAGHELELRSGENFVSKPFSPNRLLETIRQCLDQ